MKSGSAERITKCLFEYTTTKSNINMKKLIVICCDSTAANMKEKGSYNVYKD